MNLVKIFASLCYLMLFWLSLNINHVFANEKLQSRYSTQLKSTNQNLLRIRFGTIIGSPPFGFLDQKNRMSGLNIDLVRRICLLHSNIPNCEIQAISVEEAEVALTAGTIDVLIGAITPTKENRLQFKYSQTFFKPTFFKITAKQTPDFAEIGVMDNVFNNKIRSFLASGDKISEFQTYNELFDSLSSLKISSAFVSGHAAQFWLLSDAAKSCCTFEGPIYLPFTKPSQHRFAMRRDNKQLHELIENALYTLETSGSLDELRKRYFPLIAPN